MKLPKIDELVEEQWEVYLRDPDTALLVAGPPGSGKTSLAVHRARFVTDTGKKVGLVTRNRMLVAAAARLGGGSFQTTTMHKLVFGDVKRRCGKELTGWDWNWQEIEADCAAKASVAQVFDHLIIDEAQDLPTPFFRWARAHGARGLTIFADEDQSIGSPHQNERSSLSAIASAIGVTEMHVLTHNHRNTPEIAAVAEHFHRGGLPPAVVVKRPSGDIPRLLAVTVDQLAQLVLNRLANRNEAIGLVVQSQQEVTDVYAALVALAPPGARVGMYTSRASPGDEDMLDLTAAGVTVLTSESVKGLEFASLFLLDLSRSLPCGTSSAGTANRRRLYMLCTRAQATLTLVAHPQPLSPPQLADLPPATILHR